MERKRNDDIRFLFEGFLDDRKKYNLCEGYWKRFIMRTVEEYTDNFRFIKNSYVNGLKIFDANPIVCLLFKDKAIRIILSSDSEYEEEHKNLPDYDFIAYLDTFLYQKKEYKELVLSLFMCPSAIDKAKRILKEWVISDGEKIDLTGESLSPVSEAEPDIPFRNVAAKSPGRNPHMRIRSAKKLKDDTPKPIKRPKKK